MTPTIKKVLQAVSWFVVGHLPTGSNGTNRVCWDYFRLARHPTRIARKRHWKLQYPGTGLLGILARAFPPGGVSLRTSAPCRPRGKNAKYYCVLLRPGVAF